MKYLAINLSQTFFSGYTFILLSTTSKQNDPILAELNKDNKVQTGHFFSSVMAAFDLLLFLLKLINNSSR